jgi:transposase
MFFRTKKSKHSANPTLQLVENYRDGDRIRQRVIVSLGTNFHIPKELRKSVARCVEQKLLGQTNLMMPTAIADFADRVVKKIQTDGRWDAERKQVKAFTENPQDQSVAEVFVKQVSHSYDRELGSVLIGHHFWNYLGFPEILKACGFSQIQIHTAEISVLNRLIAGDSEHKIPSWIKTTAIEDLIVENAEEFAEDRFYRIADKLLRHQSKIESDLYERADQLFGLNSAIYLYDLTNTYFEGICAKNPKAEYNKNQKEKRTDCPQIVVALVLDGQGFIRKHFTFNGKMSDSKSLEIIIKKLKSDFVQAKIPTIIMDRGVVSQENIELLKSHNLSYIVASRSSEEKQFVDDFDHEDFKILKSDKNNQVEIRLKRSGDETFLLCKSSGRYQKESAIRNRAEARLERDLEKLRLLIEQGKRTDPVKIEQAIGRLRERHRRVAHYYEIDFTPFSFDYEIASDAVIPKRLLNSLKNRKRKCDKSKISYVKLASELAQLQKKYPDGYSAVTTSIRTPHLTWHIKREKTEKLSALDGNYLLKTNRQDLDDQTIWHTYVLLTRLEKAFRNLKSDLGLRPNFHQLERRVDSHVFISILAYDLLHSVEHTLRARGVHHSWATVKRVMRSHTYATITLPTTSGAVIHVRKPGVPEAIHEEIYETLGVNYTNLPVTKTLA